MKNLKSIFTLLLALGFFSTVLAQEENEDKEMQYLFNAYMNNISISGFGGPIVGFTQIGNEFAVTSGGGGAALFNQKFFIGGYGEGLVTRHRTDIEMYDKSIGQNRMYYRMNTQFGHGGLWLGYIINPHKALHWGISTKAGFGSISLSEDTFDHERWNDFEYDNVFVLNPQIEIEMNLTQWFKINLGVGYQLVTGVNKKYEFQEENGDIVLKKFFEQKDFNKPVGHITFCFGWFNN